MTCRYPTGFTSTYLSHSLRPHTPRTLCIVYKHTFLKTGIVGWDCFFPFFSSFFCQFLHCFYVHVLYNKNSAICSPCILCPVYIYSVKKGMVGWEFFFFFFYCHFGINFYVRVLYNNKNTASSVSSVFYVQFIYIAWKRDGRMRLFLFFSFLPFLCHFSIDFYVHVLYN